MDSFGKDKKRISLIEIVWWFAIALFIWLLIRCPSEGWENLTELVQNENRFVLLQIVLTGLISFTGLFAAYLQELCFHGDYNLKTAEASLCVFGCFLVLTEQRVLELNAEHNNPFLWAGKVFMITGFLFLIIPLISTGKNDIRFILCNGICFTLLLLICVFPGIAAFGIVFPVLICLGYDILLLYRKNKAVSEKECKEKTGGIHPEEKEETVSEKENVTGTAVNQTAIQEDSPSEEIDLEEIPAEVWKEKSDPAEICDTSLSAERNGQEEPLSGIETEMIRSLPKNYSALYVYDRKEGKTYRYGENGQLYLAGAGSEPELITLIEETEKKEFRNFLNENGTRQINTKMWNRNSASYQDMIATASRFAEKEEIEQILFVDSTKSKEMYEERIGTLNKEIQSMKERVALAEDEEYRVFMSTNELLNDIIQRKSNESKLHLKHIRSYAKIFLKAVMRHHPELGLDENKIEEIAEAALLHDIGKIEVPDSILNKQDRLTAEEYEEMKKHTIYGAQLINKMPFVKKYETILKYALELALHHHERYDGKGYPDGLKGEQIPLYVQAVSMADAYEALTSSRKYRPGIAHEEACKMMREGECGVFSDEMLTILDEVGNELRDNHYRMETTL